MVRFQDSKMRGNHSFPTLSQLTICSESFISPCGLSIYCHMLYTKTKMYDEAMEPLLRPFKNGADGKAHDDTDFYV